MKVFVRRLNDKSFIECYFVDEWYILRICCLDEEFGFTDILSGYMRLKVCIEDNRSTLI